MKCLHLATKALLICLGSIFKCQKYKEIKQNLKIVQEQNNLLESQIVEVTHYLNLNMVQVHEHHSILYKLDETLLIFNGILSHKESMDSFYENIHILASHEINALPIPLF